MKEHTLIGASMLDKLEHYKDEKMIKIAYQSADGIMNVMMVKGIRMV